MTSTLSGKNLPRAEEESTPSGEGLATFLRQRHPWDTAAQVEDATGIDRETVKKWLQQAALPRLQHLFRLVIVYGPDLLAEVWPGAPDWLREARRADELARIKADIAAQEVRMAALEKRR